VVESRQIGLSLYRVILAVLTLRVVIFSLPMAEELFGVHAIVPYEDYLRTVEFLRLPIFYWPFHVPGAATILVCLTTGLAFCLLLAIGRGYTALLLFWMLTILALRNPFILDGSDNVIAVTLPFLALSQSYTRFGYSTGRAPRVASTARESTWSMIKESVQALACTGLMLQVCYIYFFTSFAKARGDLWHNGTAVFYTMRVAEFRVTEWNIPLTENHYFVVVSTLGTLFFEMAFPFLVWFRQTRPAMLAGGVLLHLGIWVFMRIATFSWIMMGTYAVFLTDSQYRSALAMLRKWYRVVGAGGRRLSGAFVRSGR
jgi:hypothetical protein